MQIISKQGSIEIYLLHNSKKMKTDLSTYSNSDYKPGPGWKKFLWYLINICFFRTGICPFSGFKVSLLRMFGARLGKGVVIKPYVNIKYPWLLSVGNFSWIGEKVWIDNLDKVEIGSHCCISQGAMLLCGNHDYKKTTFDLVTQPITLEDGCWIAARSIVCPGVKCSEHSVLTVGSVATTDLGAYGIYAGNPAVKIRERIISA